MVSVKLGMHTASHLTHYSVITFITKFQIRTSATVVFRFLFENFLQFSLLSVEEHCVFSSSVNFPKNCVRILLTQELEFISSQNTGSVLLKAPTALLRSCKRNFISFMGIFVTPEHYLG